MSEGRGFEDVEQSAVRSLATKKQLQFPWLPHTHLPEYPLQALICLSLSLCQPVGPGFLLPVTPHSSVTLQSSEYSSISHPPKPGLLGRWWSSPSCHCEGGGMSRAFALLLLNRQ